MPNYTVAAVLAGGKGTRFTSETPKQFLPLGGKAVWQWSVEAFEKCSAVEAILLVMPPDCVETVREQAVAAGYKKVALVLAGGRERRDSTRCAIEACRNICKGKGPVNLLLHDAARPLVSDGSIRRVIDALQSAPAATAAVPVSDTIAAADEAGRLCAVPPRSRLWQVQTPQGFHLPVLERAYECAARDPAFAATDDCGVVRRYLPEVPIQLVPGDRRAHKLTYPEDLAVLEQWVHQKDR